MPRACRYTFHLPFGLLQAYVSAYNSFPVGNTTAEFALTSTESTTDWTTEAGASQLQHVNNLFIGEPQREADPCEALCTQPDCGADVPLFLHPLGHTVRPSPPPPITGLACVHMVNTFMYFVAWFPAGYAWNDWISER